jgi:5-hydroxyisourate hydrolase
VSTITSHVLDTALGQPAVNLHVRLEVLAPPAGWTPLADARTDDDGRIRGFALDTSIAAGTYRLIFETRAYLEATGRPVFYPQVDVVFVVTGADAHYHVPLLLSPFGYSTYRGS